MALSQGSAISWSDIETMFTNLNNTRTKYGLTSVTADSGQGDIVASSTMTALASGVTDMASIGNLSQYAVINADIPVVGDLITPVFLTSVQTSISNTYNCSGYNSSQVSYNSNNFTSDYSYNSTNYTSCVGYNSSYDSSQVSYNSSYDSSNVSYSGYNYYFTTGVYSFKTTAGY